jgi:hypothetical protein
MALIDRADKSSANARDVQSIVSYLAIMRKRGIRPKWCFEAISLPIFNFGE